MSGYTYVPSDSPIASSLVVAPKAAEPFIRLCGDYRQNNMYVADGIYRLSDERKTAIASNPFPNNVKGMQRFLDAALFFRSFNPN